MLAMAHTGTGKTAAYLVPLVGRMMKQQRSRLPRNTSYPAALVLLPTRELAQQVKGGWVEGGSGGGGAGGEGLVRKNVLVVRLHMHACTAGKARQAAAPEELVAPHLSGNPIAGAGVLSVELLWALY